MWSRSAVRRSSVAALLLLAASGPLCACMPKLRTQLVEPGAYRLPKEGDEYDGAKAVVLMRRDRYLLLNGKSHHFYFQQQRHDVVKILTEAGLGYADVKIRLGNEVELLDLTARTVQPDGTVQELERAQLIKDETRVGKETTQDIRVRLPGVKVGSIIEYSWTTHQEYGPGVLTEVVTDDVPVLDYEMDFQVRGGQVLFDLRTYNTGNVLKLTRDGRDYRATLALKDVPARKREAFRPHGTLNDAWWIFGVRTYVFGGREHDVVKNWDHALGHIARQAYFHESERFYKGLSLEVDLKGCEGRRCAAERALELVHESTDHTEDTTYITSARLLKEVLESGRANNWEKALLYHKALERAGVESFLAVSTRYLHKGFDKSFPALTWFDHAVVYLPKQADISQPLVVDPSCEYCAIGELPWWSRDCAARVVRPYQRFDGRLVSETEGLVLRGRAPTRALTRTDVDVTLSAAGDIEASVRRSLRGGDAKDAYVSWRGYDRRGFEDMVQQDMSRRARSGEVLGFEPGECDKRKATCVYSYTMSGAGLAFSTTGDDLQLSLNLLDAEADTMLKERTRQHDVVIRMEKDEIERLRVRVPEGYRVSGLPAPAKLESDAFSFELLVGEEPGGFFVERRLSHKRGQHPRAAYEALRVPLRAFAEVREALVTLKRVAPDAPG